MQVGPKEFVKAVLRHRSEKNPVQRTLDKVASEVLSFKPTAYQAADWTAEDKGELLNMALATLHSQCVDAGVCCTQLGLGSAKWTKALVDLQRLGHGLSKDNLKILFGSSVHAQARLLWHPRATVCSVSVIAVKDLCCDGWCHADTGKRFGSCQVLRRADSSQAMLYIA